MQYTYCAYREFLRSLINHGYTPIRFCDVNDGIEFSAIIRHDVDLDMQEAVKLAMLEKEEGIRSTYFVLISSEYYNLLTGKNLNSAEEILDLGHEIGLHFDITAYDTNLSMSELEKAIRKEVRLLEGALGIEVTSMSWHIPREDLLGVHLSFLEEMGIWNAYDPMFYSGYKYVSDSMMRWREPVEEIIEKKEYKNLQILTHPIWYREVQDMTDEEILDKNRDKRLLAIGQYLDTIKPGYYTPKGSEVCGF